MSSGVSNDEGQTTGMFKCVKWYRLAIDMFRCVKWYRVGHRYVQVCQMIQDKTQVCSGVPNDIGQDTGTCIQSNRWEKYYKGCTVYLW